MDFQNFSATDLVHLPIEQALTLPDSWYRKSDFLAFETNEVLKRSFQYVGHVNQVQKAGDFFVYQLFDVPLIVLRNAKSEIKAYANVCRHRGGPLATENGSAKLLVCKYHAWTYDLDGKLKSTPKCQHIKEIAGDEIKLPEFDVKIFHGLIFVSLEKSNIDIDRGMKPHDADLAKSGVASFQFAKRITYDVRCNWKLYVDNYMEGYHVGPVHPRLSKVLTMSEYQTIESDLSVMQKSPLSEVKNPYGNSGDVLYLFLFPNMMFNIAPGRLQVNHVVPTSENTCSIVFDFFYDEHDPKKLEQRFLEDNELSDVVQKEDIWICEKVQKNLESGTYQRGCYVPSEESGLYAFHEMLRRIYREKFESLD